MHKFPSLGDSRLVDIAVQSTESDCESERRFGRVIVLGNKSSHLDTVQCGVARSKVARGGFKGMAVRLCLGSGPPSVVRQKSCMLTLLLA